MIGIRIGSNATAMTLLSMTKPHKLILDNAHDPTSQH